MVITNTSEIISIQAGQCGNQVGREYWAQLAHQHGITPEGVALPYTSHDLRFESEDKNLGSDNTLRHLRTDCPEIFFSSTDDGTFTQRSVLLDMEPSLVAKCLTQQPMINPRNIHVSENGSGAANNWKQGYTYAQQHEEEILNILDREADRCDNIAAFQLFHSVAGGTGSGLGSHVLQLLNDHYGLKKLVTTASVFPSNARTSDVVVQPYNTILTLQRLIEYSDATFVFDNDSLNSAEAALLGPENVEGSAAFERANKLVAYAMTGVTNLLRFPSYMYGSYASVVSSLVPTPDLKFLSTSIAPHAHIPGYALRSRYVSLNEHDILLELLSDKYKLNHVSEHPQYVAVLDFLVGDRLDQQEIRKGLLRAQLRTKFVPWASPTIHVVNGRKLPFDSQPGLSGYQISNNTSVVQMFSQIVRQYDLLAKRAAYINFYTESNDPLERDQVLDVFNQCKESVLSVVNEYKASTSTSYFSDPNSPM